MTVYNYIPRIIVMSVKGGTGKTMVSKYVAFMLSDAGLNVGYVDIDIDSPNAPKEFGLITNGERIKKMEQTGEKRLWVPRVQDGVQIVSAGLMFEQVMAFSKYGMDNYAIVRSLIDQTAWAADTDILVLDVPAGSSDELKAIVEAEDRGYILGAVLVAQPNTMDDLQRSLELCIIRGVYAFGIVENMKGIRSSCCGRPAVCRKCGREIVPFVQGGRSVEEVAKHFSVPYFGHIPIVEGLGVGGEAGIAMLPADVDAPIKSAVEGIRNRLHLWQKAQGGE